MQARHPCLLHSVPVSLCCTKNRAINARKNLTASHRRKTSRHAEYSSNVCGVQHPGSKTRNKLTTYVRRSTLSGRRRGAGAAFLSSLFSGGHAVKSPVVVERRRTEHARSEHLLFGAARACDKPQNGMETRKKDRSRSNGHAYLEQKKTASCAYVSTTTPFGTCRSPLSGKRGTSIALGSLGPLRRRHTNGVAQDPNKSNSHEVDAATACCRPQRGSCPGTTALVSTSPIHSIYPVPSVLVECSARLGNLLASGSWI